MAHEHRMHAARLSMLALIVSFSALADERISGRTNITEGATFVDTHLATSSTTGMVRQSGCDVEFTTASSAKDLLFGDGKASAGAYLLESGKLSFSSSIKLYFYGTYFQFRQTGGEFELNNYGYVNAGRSASYGVRTDLVFGGAGQAVVQGVCLMRLMNDAAMVFSDSIYFNHTANSGNIACVAGHHIWVHNGGTAAYAIPYYGSSSAPSGDFFAFNGGCRKMLGVSDNIDGGVLFGKKPRVCIYSKGGEVHFSQHNLWLSHNSSYADELGGYMIIDEPKDYVVKSIPIPSGHELRTREWDAIPAVVITDANGAGSNAVAVADYDWDAKTITNITVLCGGEGYSACSADDTAPAVTANLRFSNEAGDILSVPLACETGSELGGDFTISGDGSKYAVFGRATNYCHGAVIVDVDQSGVADGEATDRSNNTLRLRHNVSDAAQGMGCFPNSTNIILKSGGLFFEHKNMSAMFPACRRIELYGGHADGATISYDDVVIGGRFHLIGQDLASGASTLSMPAEGTLCVDVSCVANDVTPSISYGTVSFATGAQIAVKNLKSLARGQTAVVLDCSETTVDGTPVVVQPDSEEGRIWWDATELKLYAHRRGDGIIVTFR